MSNVALMQNVSRHNTAMLRTQRESERSVHISTQLIWKADEAIQMAQMEKGEK